MPSSVPGFEYDIFISYRHNDNLDGWVTDFVQNLERELKATLKDKVSIYFDQNPHDGLLETHSVEKSLDGKLKCLIFIPVISQTYCDTKSFAWQNEFCVFNKLSREDQFGREVKLMNGNVASRILPVKIHDIDNSDKALIESELGVPLRAIDFIYKEPGVNRPLKPADSKHDNQNKTDYKNQVNKLANAVKELVQSLSNGNSHSSNYQNENRNEVNSRRNNKPVFVSVAVLFLIGSLLIYYLMMDNTKKTDLITKHLDRAEKYFEEAGRFDDKRYHQSALEAIQKALEIDSLNERALYLLSTSEISSDTTDYLIKRIFSVNPNSKYGFLARAMKNLASGQFALANSDLQRVETLDPNNKDALRMLSFVHMVNGDYINAWKYARRHEQVSGEALHEILSSLYLELGDFKEAKRQLQLKRHEKEFSCGDIESLQKIYLCEGNFEVLEKSTDSICSLSKCENCPYWILRAKMHVGKYTEAALHVKPALKNYGPITWRYPAFVLDHVGKKDSAMVLLSKEIKYDFERLADTSYQQGIPLYSLSAIHAMQGNARESLKWLRQYADKGFELGSEWYIGHDPLFDELQKDNEYFADFIQIVQKAQLRKTEILNKIKELERQELD